MNKDKQNKSECCEKVDNIELHKKRKKRAELWMWLSFAFWWMSGFLAYGILENLLTLNTL